MLYKFKSKATGDLIMLEPQGRQILQILGKVPEPTGILLAGEILDAISALRKAVELEEAEIEAAQAPDGSTDSASKSGGRGIRLKQRVVPFIDMLQRAHAEDVDVVWGV
jgi:hypothetical protein